MRTLAIIPARSGSKRVPQKNIRRFLGKPLINWTVEFATTIAWFDTIHVSTDSREIADIAVNCGATAPYLRDASLATDTATSIDVVLDVVDWYSRNGTSFDAIALLQPTSPVRRPHHWDRAREMIEQRGFDSAVGARSATTHPYLAMKARDDGSLQPFFPTESRTLRSQDFPQAHYLNGTLYLARMEALKSERSFMCGRCGLVSVEDEIENIDIDTEADWAEAERIVSETINP